MITRLAYYFPLVWDPTYILVIVGIVFSLIASSRMKATFSKYSKVQSYSGLTGQSAAAQILLYAGISDVQINQIAGDLTDNYNPRENTLNLSQSTAYSNSVAAIGVAAHECGHAMQHREGYAPIKVRNALVPVANLGSTLAWPIILIGLLFNNSMSPVLLNIGIFLFLGAVLFQLVTLPVELDASRRALVTLQNTGLLAGDELDAAGKVLKAAAWTYVAAAAASMLQLLRIILLSRGRRRS
ncbi:MAG: zinc metallopeptidase [Lachnospiraceae bacterium]|jgi:Zn-dependent membrane protease YugP|nr:zinc metallopeptidase [Lachnospiraceae bacterium]